MAFSSSTASPNVTRRKRCTKEQTMRPKESPYNDIISYWSSKYELGIWATPTLASANYAMLHALRSLVAIRAPNDKLSRAASLCSDARLYR